MGCLGGLIGLAFGSASDKVALNRRMQGRTDEQKKVIKYFMTSDGCLSKNISDQDYEGMVMAKAQSMDFKKKALDKIGLDESQVNEVPPVHFEDYWWGDTEKDNDKYFAKCGKDNIWRTSAYQITWLFFSSTQVYVYKYTLNMDEDGKKEHTEEYFYKDITNFSASSESVEKMVPGKAGGCKGVQDIRTSVETNRFMLSAMGDKLYCAMKQNDYTEKAIQGMKAKLREKKG